jgi:hypothetical protein
MVPVPEMVAFGERFGFEFAAHEIGDANRSARVERPFRFIEGNFLGICLPPCTPIKSGFAIWGWTKAGSSLTV